MTPVEIVVTGNATRWEETVKKVQESLRVIESNAAGFSRQFSAAISSAAGGFRQLGAAGNTASGTIGGASKRIQQDVSAIERSSQRSFQQGARYVKQFATAVISFATDGGFRAMASRAVEFEKAIANVGTILDKTAPPLERFRDGINELSKTSTKSAVDLAGGLYEAISSGVKAGEALGFIEVAGKAATAGLASTQDAVRALTVVQNTYGASAGTTREIADKLFQTVNVGVITFPELARNIGKAATGAHLAGVQFNEFLGSIANLTKGGLTAASALQGMNALTNALANPQKKAAAFAKAHGIELSQQRIATEGLVPIMQELHAKLGDNFQAWRQLFPQQNAARAAMILSAEAAQGLSKDIKAVTESAGSMDKAFAIQSKTVDAAMSRLHNSFQAVFNELFTKGSPVMIQLLDDLATAITKIDLKPIKSAIDDMIKGTREWLKVTEGLRDVYLSVAKIVFDLVTTMPRWLMHVTKRVGDAGELAGRLFADDTANNRGVRNAEGAYERPLSMQAAASAQSIITSQRMGPPSGAPMFGEDLPNTPLITSGETTRIAAELGESAAGAGAAPGSKRGKKKSFWQKAAEDLQAYRDYVGKKQRAHAEALKHAAESATIDAEREDEQFRDTLAEAESDVAQSNKESLERSEMDRRYREYDMAMARQGREQDARFARAGVAAQYGGAFASGGLGGVIGAAGGALSEGLVQGGAQAIAGGGIGGFASGLAQFASAGAIQFGASKLGELLAMAGEMDPKKFGEAIVEKFKGARIFVEQLVANIPTLVRAVVTEVPRLIAAIVKQIPTIIQSFIELAITEWPRFLVNITSSLLGVLTSANFWDRIINSAVDGLSNGIAQMFRQLVDWVKGLLGGVDKLNEAGKATSKIPVLGNINDGLKTGTGWLGGLSPWKDNNQFWSNWGNADDPDKWFEPGEAPGGVGNPINWFDWLTRGPTRAGLHDSIQRAADGLRQTFDTGRYASRAMPAITTGRAPQSIAQATGQYVAQSVLADGRVPAVHFSVQGGKYDKVIERMIGEAVVTRVRDEGGRAATIRQVADGPDHYPNFPGLAPLVNRSA